MSTLDKKSQESSSYILLHQIPQPRKIEESPESFPKIKGAY